MSSARSVGADNGSPPRLLAGPAGLPLLMGVVNVTPDSFSDGGQWFEVDDGIARGLELAAAGAGILDVGGESTRPGAARPDEAEELRRTLPVVRALSAGAEAPPVSIDTMRARVAAAAIEAGATLVNDVSGGLADPDMVRVIADAPHVDYVVMHWRGHSADMQSRAVYADVVAEVRVELDRRVAALVDAGIDPARIVIDPGLGFAKTGEHNWQILGRLEEFVHSGPRVLIGASRKAFLGHLEAAPDGTPAPPHAREAATAAITLLCAQAGVWCVRVHEVGPSRSALRVLAAIAQRGQHR